MQHTKAERQSLARRLFEMFDGPTYAAELAETFTRRLSKRRRRPGQRTRRATADMISQWKARSEIPSYAADIAAALIRKATGSAS